MAKIAASLTALPAGFSIQDSILAAAEAGFEAVAIPFPYDMPAQDIRNALARAELPLVMISGPPPNYTGGAAGYAAVAGGQERFRHDFRRTLRYAQTLKPQFIHIRAGVANGSQAFETLVENLRWACEFAPSQRLLIAPIAAREGAEDFLCDFDLAAAVIRDVASDKLGLQFDTREAQMITGNVSKAWDKYAPFVRHVQAREVPQQPTEDRDRIDFPAFFARIEGTGYAGWVGAEYTASDPAAEVTGWLAEALKGPPKGSV